MERTKEPLSREHGTSQHALHGARHEIYDSSRRKATKQGAEKIEATKQKRKKEKNCSIFRVDVAVFAETRA